MIVMMKICLESGNNDLVMKMKTLMIMASAWVGIEIIFYHYSILVRDSTEYAFVLLHWVYPLKLGSQF